MISGVAAAAIFSSFAIPQVRVEANQLLSLFRVNQLEMVKITHNDLIEIQNWVSENKNGSIDIKGIGKLEMAEKTGDPQFFDTYESAEEAGYPVAKLGGFNLAGMTVIPASTITFTLDVEKTNALLTQLGSEHQFEESLDGEAFSVSTFGTIQSDYISEEQHVSYLRTQSPEINVPEGVSIGELRATLLSLPFLPENVKTQIAGIENIDKTLPIPYAETEGSVMREVRVGGTQGFAVEREEGSFLIWQDKSDIHTISARGKLSADDLIHLSKQISE